MRQSRKGTEGEDATDFADNALEGWQHLALPSVTGVSPAALVIFEALNALAKTSTTVIMDWADTPDVRDRYTRDSAQRLVHAALDGVLSDCKRWLAEGPPSSDEIQQRFTAVAADIKDSMDVLGERTAEMDAEDAETAADPYGAILLHRDPSRSDAPIFEKVCSFTEEENKRYCDAYERLRRMIDSELLQHISDESGRNGRATAQDPFGANFLHRRAADPRVPDDSERPTNTGSGPLTGGGSQSALRRPQEDLV